MFVHDLPPSSYFCRYPKIGRALSMQLSKLEIKGFKSFGDKVTINFDAGITGIVGPNGCGKSNVVDAIRWVLGEQRTKNLRSDKMENVIFNGTKNRKPQQMAEVSLTFLNTKNLLPTEYTEVTITRRYYRSGDSEYLLNGVNCRLKDINNLFMDTGIGPDSYAIIELKMVDDLLNDTSGSRRELFEEAAGISKFKARKKETIKKVGDTDADLARVEDLLFEIEKNLRSLEKQAKQAERYYKAKDEYKEISLELAKKIVSRQREALIDIQAQLNAENDQKTALTAQIAELEAAIEQTQTAILQKEKLLASRQRVLNEHVSKIRQYESEQKLKNERLRFLTDRRTGLERQIDDEQHNIDVLHNRIAVLKQEQQSIKRQADEIDFTLTTLKADYEAEREQVQALQKKLIETTANGNMVKNEIFQLNKSLEIKQMQYNALRLELEKNYTDASHQRASLDALSHTILDLRDRIADLERELTDRQTDELALQESIAKNIQQAEDLRLQIAKEHRKTDALQNEYNLTKSLVDSMEGFPEAVRFLHSDKRFAKNTPLLSDIINAADEFKLCIENYLQPYMSHYVVDNEEQALAGINLLSEAGKGRANFFILSQLMRGNIPTPHKQEINGAVHALSVIDFDTRFTPLIYHLLGNVYILTEQQETLPYAAQEVTLITQNGKIIRQPFSLSGGSVGLFEGKRLGRAKNLEKLSRQLAELNEKIKKDEDRLKALYHYIEQQKAESKKAEIETAQRELNRLQQEATAARIRQEQLQQLVSSSDLKKEDIEARMETLREEIAETEPQVRLAQQQLTQTENELSSLNNELFHRNEILNRKQTAYNEQNMRSYQLRNRLETLEKEIEYRQNDLVNLRRRMEQAQAELQKTEAEIRELAANNTLSSSELLSLYEEKESIEAGVRQAEQDYFAARGSIAETEKEIRELRRRRETADQLIAEMNNRLNEARLQMASLKERLSVEFEIDLEAVMNAPNLIISDLSEEFLREEQQKCKERIERIGAINPMAMEAYNEIKQRYDFINEQKNDLLTAKASLLQTIDEIDAIARKQFTESFEQIRTHFIRVFRSLFSEEDTCDLILLDPENPLESAIDIMAKPKGKRPLTINQLSGGEKTLTATSLLFAIYLLRPAPFCIFDEVDAPLDDANIDKFNNIIRKFADNSQFIIVTHNKRTMSATDVMYGVTMLEQGVSCVVPVDLRMLAE
jgi:chromosome segregation protein